VCSSDLNFRAFVIDRGDGPHGIVEPNNGSFYDGEIITLIATPDPNYRVKAWYGTDNDASKEPNNTVTVRGANVFVAVEFALIGQNIINLYDARMILDRRSPFPTIQDAIDAAGPFYSVVVSNGIYTGTGNYDIDLRAGLVDPNFFRPITVRSENGPEECIIDCQMLGRAFIFDSNEDPNYIVDGFTITNGSAQFGGAILIDAASPRITNCKIINNRAIGDGGAIYCTNGSPVITNTEITYNDAGGFGGGIYCQATSAPAIINCLITYNTSGDIGGAMYLYDSDATITLCTIAYNYGLDYGDLAPYMNPKGGIACRDSDPVISNCIIGRSGGIWAMGLWGDQFSAGDDLYNCVATYSCIENGDDGDGNIDDNPLWASGGLGDFYLSQMQAGQPQTSPCVNAGEQYILGILQTTYNLGLITTSILNQFDIGYADMGYHYPFFTGPPFQYTLEIIVIGNGTVEPNQSPEINYYTPGELVSLKAIPDPNYRVRRWTGTNNDSSVSVLNSVTMYGNRVVVLEFEPAIMRILNVSTDGRYTYMGIQQAINDAREGDMIVLHSGRYSGTGYTVMGKNITITGTNPDDPNVILSTIIDCANELEGGIHLIGAPGGRCVLNGITIMNSHTFAIDSPGPDGDGARGIEGGDNLPYIYLDSAEGGFTGNGSVSSNSAITIIGNHIVSNCVIRNCSVTAGDASGGNQGGDDQDGGNGGNGGYAGGAGIYIGDVFDYYYDYPEDFNDPNWWEYYRPVLLRWGSSPIIRNCVIDNCVATAGNGGNGADGGARAGGGNGGVPGRATGAGVYCDVATSPTFINCIVNNCRAVGGNGGNGGNGGSEYGMGGYGGLTYADPCQPDPELFSTYGGGIYCGMLSEPCFVDCTFSNNVTQGSVSGVGGNNVPSGIQQQPRRNYNIPSYGAGVYCETGSSSTFENCNLQANRTTYQNGEYIGYGGGVCFDGSKSGYEDYYSEYYYYHTYSYYLSYFFDSNLYDANAMGNCFATLVDCNIANNSASVGGGVYGVASTLDIVDCNFADNSSYVGGGLCSTDGEVNIVGCDVQRNIASPAADPNVIVDPNDPNTFRFGAGAGIYCFSTDTIIRDCNITYNMATGSGGGVYLFGDSNSPQISNCLITNNTAGRDGGGVSVNWSANPVVTNCTFVGNTASSNYVQQPGGTGIGGGLYCSYGSNCDVTRSIFRSNFAPKGHELAVGTGFEYDPRPASLTVKYSDVEGGWADVYVDRGCKLEPNKPTDWISKGKNIDEDPNFIAGYYLSQIAAGQTVQSKCVDGGVVLASIVGMNKYTTRVDGVSDAGIVDMGYHYLLGPKYRLHVNIVGKGAVKFEPAVAPPDPAGGLYNCGVMVTMTAKPDKGYRLKGWYDANDVELLSIEKTFEVVMDSNQTFTVEFEEPGTTLVQGGPDVIQVAIDAAKLGETLIVSAGVYNGNINTRGKDIKLVCTNPDDPNVVARTIIDCQQAGRGFIFNTGEDSNTVIDGFTIIDGNVAGGENGGGIYVDSNTSPTIMNIVIRDCVVTGGGGGGIFVNDFGWPTFINCQVINCSADIGGGAFCDSNSAPIFNLCTFSGNVADANGGGMYCGMKCISEVNDCTFSGNAASEDGGGLFCDPNSIVVIADCNFAGNSAVRGGGAHCEAMSSTTVLDSIFINNTADSGGAISWIDANMLIIDANIVYNSALQGGGLWCVYGRETAIIGCTLGFNQAGPAAIDPNDPNDPNLEEMGQGGGMYCFGTAALIRDCIINRNVANTSGGGVYISGDSNSPQLSNCLITSNLAGRDGGGVSINWYAMPFISNCTFAGNATTGYFGEPGNTGFGGGLYCSYHSDSEVVDSIFWNNFAVKGFEMAVATGFEPDPRPATLTVSYSDVKGGWAGIYVDKGCTLLPAANIWSLKGKNNGNNIDADPLFVAGWLGDYYLSQMAVGDPYQTKNSPCVDAGSDYAGNVDMIRYTTPTGEVVGYTTRTDGELERSKVDMGYHYRTFEPCRFCDLVYDQGSKGIIDFRDFAILASRWLNSGCSDLNGWCNGADLTFDTFVNLKDLASFAECWLVADTEAPMPDPAEWEIEPYLASATSISMVARIAFDAWGWAVDYNFVCVYGRDKGGTDSGWQANRAYTDIGLIPGYRYGYRVKARDEIGNETEWSVIRYAGVDNTPPAPAPAWATPPTATGPNSIMMESTVAYDDSGVTYGFWNITRDPAGNNIVWQSSTQFIDVNLDPNTSYGYRVEARDNSENMNETGWSVIAYAKTWLPPDRDAPLPNPARWDPITDANGYNGKPLRVYRYGGNTDYWAVMRADPATDASGFVEYNFICTNESRFSSGWQASPAYECQVGGLFVVTKWVVKVRDLYHNETYPSDPEWPAEYRSPP
jgi:hypothetical protein